MKIKNILFFILCFFLIKLQAQGVSIEQINTFIKNNCSSKNNYWTHVEVANNKLIIFNQSNKSIYKREKPKNGKLTFQIDKINTEKIKHKKNGIILSPNVKGNYATYFFNSERNVEKVLIQTNDMKKSDRLKLIDMLINFVEHYDANENNIANAEKELHSTKVNHLITSLFLNYDLSHKNHNISIIYPYIPFMLKGKVKEIDLTSNLGGANENLIIQYHTNGLINQVTYTRPSSTGNGNVLFEYKFEYENQLLKRVTLKGKEKYIFDYDQGKINSIAYTFRDINYTYRVHYKNNTAYLNLDVKKNGKNYFFTNKSSTGVANDYIQWNTNFQVINYVLDIFKSKNIKYNAKDSMTSFNFSNTLDSNNSIDFKYTYDSHNNWITQENEEIQTKRKIAYE